MFNYICSIEIKMLKIFKLYQTKNENNVINPSALSDQKNLPPLI